MTESIRDVVVAQALEAAAQAPNDERNRPPADFWAADGWLGAMSNELAKRLQHLLPTLSETAVCDGSNWQKLQVRSFSLAMLQAAVTRGEPGAQAFAGKVLGLEPVVLLDVAALVGVVCATRFSLGGGVFLVPFGELAYGHTQDQMARFSGQSWITGSAEHPSAALIVPFRQDLTSLADLGERRRTMVERRQRILDLATTLSLSGKCQPIVQARWTQSDDYLLNYVLLNSRELFSHDVRHWWGEVGEVEASDVDEARILATLPEAPKGRVLLSLARLNRALLTTDVGDSLVDMAISLEALFGDPRAQRKRDLLADAAVNLVGETWEGEEVRKIV